ncbi:DNA helicase MCM9 [Taenia crassiceps]|uniref:DNA helicase n=1 Tax=Taenia crassiceps TaxID=6207 RepID=A0ABR4QMF9_9CEST
MDTLSAFNDALSCVIAQRSGSSKSSTKCAVRIVSLPPISEVFRNVIPKSDDVGRFLALHCTVTRVGAIQVVQLERSYSCSKCGHTVKVEADFNQFYALSPPRRCPNLSDRCVSTAFNVVVENDSSPLHSFQEIRVNERLGYLAVGRMPRSMVCCLDAELVDTVRPGDDIILNGILTHRWRPPKVGLPCDIETVFRANSIENLSEMRFRGELGGDNFTQEMGRRFSNYWSLAKHKGDFKAALRLRDEIVKSICPDVYGLYVVKLSLALVLAGAPPCLEKFDYNATEGERVDDVINGDGTDFRVRGNIHLLLIGEPSTAKSALLRASCRLAGRAIFTAATGTTAAGLTAAAVRDTSGWALEAGALVLADGGVCAIDEFTSLRGADRAAVHEAMEQQTVSLAKAGLVAQLNCRCAVIAASPLPTDTEHSSNILPTPLLSRFDLVWRLLDPVGCHTWDSAVAGHVLGFKVADNDRDDVTKGTPVRRITWTTEELRNYISWVRGEFQPRLSSGAAILLQRYYELRRRTLRRMHGMEDDQTVAGRTTLRLLESLVRLTQAHARLMARPVAVVEDAVMVIWLMDCSFQSTFGRSASAIEVSGYCLSPEETVKRHGMEYTFEEIIDAVFAQLNLDPEDVSNGWFSSISPAKLEFQPIYMSTQVNDQGTTLPDEPSLTKAEVSQMESISDAENDYPSPKRAKFRGRKDFLNFQNLAPEDWTFANIDTDFDL